MRYFSKTTAEKITQQCFPSKSKVTCKNLALEAKKLSLKSHLGTYLGALQFIIKCGHTLRFLSHRSAEHISEKGQNISFKDGL